MAGSGADPWFKFAALMFRRLFGGNMLLCGHRSSDRGGHLRRRYRRSCLRLVHLGGGQGWSRGQGRPGASRHPPADAARPLTASSERQSRVIRLARARLTRDKRPRRREPFRSTKRRFLRARSSACPVSWSVGAALRALQNGRVRPARRRHAACLHSRR